jgi:O-antigen ligase
MLNPASLTYRLGDSLTRYVGYFCVAIWGAGQLVPLEWWYLHGITAGDVIFLVYFALAVTLSKGFRASLISIARDNRFYVISILGMICALLFSVWLNADKYIVSPYYIMSVLRSGYFLLVSLVVVHWATTSNPSVLCKFYLLGLVVAWIWQFTISSISPDDITQVKCGYFVMHNPNVFGNMLGVGIIFSTVLIMERQPLLAFLISAVLAYLSLYCFSKGAWAMVITGILALIFAGLHAVKMTIDLSERRRTAKQLAVLVALLVAGVVVGAPKILCLLEHKMAATSANGSLELRMAFLKDAGQVAIREPFGVGVGRSAESPIHSSGDDSGGFVGYSSCGNPHSAFLFLMVNGGIVVLVLFVLAVGYPFYKLWRASPRSAYLNLYLFFALITFIISGSFQLQIYAQHFFWVFAGLLITLANKYHFRRLQTARV